MVRRFVIYGLFGWCMEIFWTGFGALMRGDVKLTGKTYIWMFLIYGLAVFLEPIHDRIRHHNVIVRGGVYAVLIFAVEYFAGFLFRRILGVCPWDYSRSPFSINGLIRIDYAPVWFFAGLLFEKAHNELDRLRIFIEDHESFT